MKKFAFGAAVAAMAFATPAMAQDADTDASGVFVGVVGGLDVLGVEAGAVTDRETGVVYGITAGYDVDAGDAVIGLEVEASDTSISPGIGDAGLDLYGGIRLGLKINENDDLVYLKAGYTNVDVDLVDNLEGVRLGAGFEKNFSGNFFGRLEYRYSTYNLSDVLLADINGNRHQIGVTIGAKF